MLKDTSSDELMKAFDQVRAGTPYLSNDLAMQVALVRTGVRPNPLAELTPRELEVLGLMATGRSNAEIAEQLVVGETTVKTHVARILTKLDVHSRLEAVAWANQHGLV